MTKTMRPIAIRDTKLAQLQKLFNEAEKSVKEVKAAMIKAEKAKEAMWDWVADTWDLETNGRAYSLNWDFLETENVVYLTDTTNEDEDDIPPLLRAMAEASGGKIGKIELN